ncbi:MAG: hypothetical protein ACQESW_03445 [Bacteroidota bacterium]
MPNSTKKNSHFPVEVKSALKWLPLFLLLFHLAGCAIIQPSADKVAERKTKRIEKQEERARKKQLEQLREAHLNRQSDRTRSSMERNRQQAEAWRKAHQTKAPIGYRIKQFFHNLFTPNQAPKDGLFKKGVQKRKKKNIFKRIFKRKKRNG